MPIAAGSYAVIAAGGVLRKKYERDDGDIALISVNENVFNFVGSNPEPSGAVNDLDSVRNSGGKRRFGTRCRVAIFQGDILADTTFGVEVSRTFRVSVPVLKRDGFNTGDFVLGVEKAGTVYAQRADGSFGAAPITWKLIRFEPEGNK